MRVLILGAGASVDAQYPLASRLTDALDEFVRHNAVGMQLTEAWTRFTSYRNKAEGLAQTILTSANPEVVLSFLDLLAAADSAHDLEGQRILRESMSISDMDEATLKAAIKRQEEHYSDGATAPYSQAAAARRGYLTVLNYFLWYCHDRDSRNDEPDFGSLDRDLASLEAGDVVITTNWDTLPERVLMENGRWTPSTGYGFDVELAAAYGHSPLPPEALGPSKIDVLKLHGSYGWVKSEYGRRVTEEGNVTLAFEAFLALMPFPTSAGPIVLRDRRTPELYEFHLEPLYVMPTYFKQTSGGALQRVWFQAGEALRSASEVKVVGYSLPESDVGVRTLLNVLRFRLESGDVHVEIHDPSRPTLERWNHFLAGRAKLIQRGIVDG